MTINQMAAKIETEARDALCDDHGETMVNPSPEPSRVRINVPPVDASAPAIMGAQFTPDVDDSTPVERTVSESVDIMSRSYRTKSMIRMIIGIGMPNSQRRMPRPIIASCVREFAFGF
jgi:hypothetical protein